MKTLKNLLVIGILFALVILSSGNMIVLFILAAFNLILLSFNLLARKSIALKPYFLSPYNVFSAKYSKEFKVDIPAHLAFDKILEVIAESGFKLITQDKEQLQILAVSSMGFKSWGENIYFSLKEVNGSTVVQFNSAALFQIYTWGKNEDNYSLFFKKLEESFII